MTSARIVSRHALRYDDGPDPALDRPAHVRSGSAMRLVETAVGRRLVIAQDDAQFFAFVDPVTMSTTSIPLPPGPGGRRQLGPDTGLKEHKLDLESMEQFDDVVIALGSASLPARERAVLLRLPGRVPAARSGPEVRIVDASALFVRLRALRVLAAAELNIEGMCVFAGPRGADRVRLFQRGNGAGAIDATVDFDAAALRAFFVDGGVCPSILDARAHELGTIDGARLTFTDACARRDGTILVTAAAEASPNAVDDGVVVGCAFGVLGQPLGPILDEDGRRYVGKPEGLALDPDDETRAWVVVDPDDPFAPALLLSLALSR